MLHRKTHNRMTRFFMRNSLDWNTVNAINERIDNPTYQDVIMSRMLGNKFAYPNLAQVGHRKVNHDFFTAIMIGMQKGGVKGIEAAVYHHLEDIMSNNLRDNL